VKNYLLYKNTITNASSVVFRNDVRSMPFDEISEMRFCGDWFFWSVYLRNKKIGFIPETLNYFRCHQKATRNNNELASCFQRLEEIALIVRSIKKHYSINLLKKTSLSHYK